MVVLAVVVVFLFPHFPHRLWRARARARVWRARAFGGGGVWRCWCYSLLGLLALDWAGVSVLFASLSSHHHAWVIPVLYTSIACLVISILAMLIA